MEKGKCLLFIRTSTDAQETQSQLKETKEYAESKGYKDFVVLEQRGASAYKVTNKYVELVEELKNTILNDKDITAVAVFALNRLSRNPSKAHEIEEFLVKHKIQLHCKIPEITLLNNDGTENDGAGMVFSIYAKISQLEINELRLKVKRARTRDRALKKYTGGKPPSFGYMVEDGYLVPHPQNSSIVKEMYELYATGQHSYSSLAREVRERYGIELTDCHVREIMIKTRYYDGVVYPPIISEELYNKVKEQRKNSAMKPSSYKHYTFANRLIQCPRCTHTFTVSMGRYVCPNAKYGCRAPNVSTAILDGLLWLICSHLESERLLHSDSKKELLQNKAVLATKIKSMDNYTSKGEKARQRAKEMALRGFIDLDTLEARLKEIDNEEKDIREKIEKWKEEIREIDRLVEEDSMNIRHILELSEQISSYDEEQMRSIVRRWVRRIDYTEDWEFTIKTLTRTYKAKYDRYDRKHNRWFTLSGKPIVAIPIERDDKGCRFGINRCKPADIATTLAWLNGSVLI